MAEVRDYLFAAFRFSQTTLRSVGGQADLNDRLSQRDKLNARIPEIVDAQTEPPGVTVMLVELKISIGRGYLARDRGAG